MTAAVAPWPFVCQQPFEDADRAVKRGAHARRRLAVPAAVVQLLGEQPRQQGLVRLAEIGAEGQNPAVDAGLDLALEEGLVALPVGDVVPSAGDRQAGLRAGRIEPHVAQQDQGVGGLAVGGVDVARVADLAPLAIFRLALEQPGTPAFRGDARALGRDRLVRLAGQVAHHLPADRGVGIQQPVHDRHGSCLTSIAHLSCPANVAGQQIFPGCVA